MKNLPTLFKIIRSRCRSYDVKEKNESSIFQNPALKCQESTEPWLKYRYTIVFLVCILHVYFAAFRINIGVSIVAMVNYSALSIEEIESDSCTDLITNMADSERDLIQDGEFRWSPELQGYIIGSSYLFYAIATPFGGMLTEMFGCKKVIIFGCLLTSLFTLVSPFAAWCHVYLLIAAQSLRGMFQGIFFPAQSSVIGNWCPKSERGFSHTLVITGSCVGTVLGSYVSGVLCESSLLGGWPMGFFLLGGTGVIVSVAMGFFLYDAPSLHPRISPAELKYISKNQESVLTDKMPKTPWRQLLTSIPVYALSYAYFGQFWAFVHFFALHPTFLGTILHYPIRQNGLFSALPFLLQMVFALGSGWLSSVLVNKNYITVDTSRKLWNFLGCFGFSVCLLGVYFAECNRDIIVVLSIISLACAGFAFSGCWITSTDMSPTFAAAINSVAITLEVTSNIIAPIAAGFLTTGEQTLEQWHKIIFITIGVVLSSGIIFAVFGSAEIQPWNEIKEEAKGKVEQRIVRK